jgi:Flp pilus assembly protein TadG
MPYRTMGRIHARLARLRHDEAGQGTVEYVGLMLMLAALLGGVVAAAGLIDGNGLAKAIAGKLKDTIENVGAK